MRSITPQRGEELEEIEEDDPNGNDCDTHDVVIVEDNEDRDVDLHADDTVTDREEQQLEAAKAASNKTWDDEHERRKALGKPLLDIPPAKQRKAAAAAAAAASTVGRDKSPSRSSSLSPSRDDSTRRGSSPIPRRSREPKPVMDQFQAQVLLNVLEIVVSILTLEDTFERRHFNKVEKVLFQELRHGVSIMVDTKGGETRFLEQSIAHFTAVFPEYGKRLVKPYIQSSLPYHRETYRPHFREEHNPSPYASTMPLRPYDYGQGTHNSYSTPLPPAGTPHNPYAHNQYWDAYSGRRQPISMYPPSPYNQTSSNTIDLTSTQSSQKSQAYLANTHSVPPPHNTPLSHPPVPANTHRVNPLLSSTPLGIPCPIRDGTCRHEASLLSTPSSCLSSLSSSSQSSSPPLPILKTPQPIHISHTTNDTSVSSSSAGIFPPRSTSPVTSLFTAIASPIPPLPLNSSHSHLLANDTANPNVNAPPIATISCNCTSPNSIPATQF
jgi:hypothetical protein